MNAATRGTLVGAACGGLVWAGTGTWQFFAVAMMGVACTWLFPPSRSSQPRRRVREFVRVEIRDVDKIVGAYSNGMTRACYDYGGCQWAGDGCAGKPLVLGPGEGCLHTAGKRILDRCEVCCQLNQFCDCRPCLNVCDGSVRCPCMGN